MRNKMHNLDFSFIEENTEVNSHGPEDDIIPFCRTSSQNNTWFSSSLPIILARTVSSLKMVKSAAIPHHNLPLKHL